MQSALVLDRMCHMTSCSINSCIINKMAWNVCHHVSRCLVWSAYSSLHFSLVCWLRPFSGWWLLRSAPRSDICMTCRSCVERKPHLRIYAKAQKNIEVKKGSHQWNIFQPSVFSSVSDNICMDIVDQNTFLGGGHACRLLDITEFTQVSGQWRLR